MFKDTFESGPLNGPRARSAQPTLSPVEQAFWRVVQSDADLTRTADQLKTRGRFEPATGSIRYRFAWNNQPKSFDAQITAATDVIQLRNFFKTCSNGVNGVFERPNISPYLRPNRRPL